MQNVILTFRRDIWPRGEGQTIDISVKYIRFSWTYQNKEEIELLNVIVS